MNHIEEIENCKDILYLILEWRFAQTIWSKHYWMTNIIMLSRDLFDRLFIDELRSRERIDENFINQLNQIVLERLEVLLNDFRKLNL